MRLLISFAALFLSVILLQLSSGALSPLDALSGLQQGFSRTQVGMLGSSHFLGFFIGCWCLLLYNRDLKFSSGIDWETKGKQHLRDMVVRAAIDTALLREAARIVRSRARELAQKRLNTVST